MNSDYNSEYIASSIEKDTRLDDRKLEAYRKITLETGVTKNAEGSAKCKIGDTEVMVGIKLGIGEPYPDSPDQGTIIVTAELSPLASPEFELGPPGQWATELARIVDRSIRESKTIDFKTLCIKKEEKVWMVFIDIYPINDDGNLIDASVLAAAAALKTTKYPKLVKNKDDYKIDYNEHATKKLELNTPAVTVTVSTIGNKMIVDATREEEKAIESRLSVALVNGRIHALQKGNTKGLKIEQIDQMLELAIKKEGELRKLLPK
ncbi:MAG: exosome complex protein Rrp42 [Nanoarchaeota archaeon]|nr:exosome complex protein Rrp42 [Nanoarchaeota archaeon]